MYCSQLFVEWYLPIFDQFSSVAQSCPTLCDPMNRSKPGLPVHQQLPEFTQSHVEKAGVKYQEAKDKSLNCFMPSFISRMELKRPTSRILDLPGRSEVKNPPANSEDMGSIPGLGRSPGERNGNPLQYSYLSNPMDRGAWQAVVPRVAKELDTT